LAPRPITRQPAATTPEVAVVAAATAEGSERDDTVWQVQVPGGSCSVTWRADGTVLLTGPAVIVAELDLDDSWLEAALAAAGSA